MNSPTQNSNPHTTIQMFGYHITETLYTGSRTIVYRAIRNLDQLPVVIKLLKNPYPSFSELVQFRNQYTIAKNLTSPLIIKTYSLESYKNSYVLVMEDFGGISLKEWEVGINLILLQDFLEIAISLCNALEILYHERIIHKDIKPSNILINPQTQQVKLIDFSIASLLPRETQTLVNPNVLEGTLAYISPEQTGRMNRGIDYRTDFYSLGVTFYELLAGELPFQSDDLIELVHYHIAKQPPKLGDKREIPPILSEIVMKLMAKNAEDRYQSALGLKFDLEQCLTQLQETGEIQSFEIAQQDLSDRFLIPDKLYGREAEIETLLEAFGRVAHGASELMLVTGFSGIGKTAIVNEVHKPIVRSRGYFIKGKFDQFQRNIPFSGLVQALRNLMGQLLSESDTQLEEWKAKILSALGENGQVLIDVIPELEKIISPQPKAIELTSSAAQNRFNLLFLNFIQVFATPQHPLVMFLDDLQWADSASLKAIELLMSQAEEGYLLIIGAYRDNEVYPTHPLILILEEIKKNNATVNTICLTPLSQLDVNDLIADTLSCEFDRALPLCQLVYRKAKGNPFFTTQFLKALYEDRWITFDWQTRSWQCDVAQVRLLSLSEDVVEFMALQLQKLPTGTQNILKLAACIGNQFDLATLAIISEQSEIETATTLWKALQEELILPQSEIYKFYQNSDFKTQHLTEQTQYCNYKFLHDRIQQAAYFLIPENERQITHLKIGRLLLEKTTPQNLEEKLFSILNQINYGVNLLSEQSERELIARLNLKAGEKAKNSTAYEAALKYLNIGKMLLSSDSWETNYALTHHLYTSLAEAEYLNGNYKQAEEVINLTLKKSISILDRVPLYRVKLQLYNVQSQFVRAIEVGLFCLQELNVNLEPNPPQKEELQVEKLSHLPLMSDPHKEAAMEVLIALTAPAYAQQPELLIEIINTLMNLSIQYGNSKYSPYGYCLYGMILCATMEDIDRGYQLGQMSVNLLDQVGAKLDTAKVLNIFGNCIRHWKKPARENIDLAIGVQGFCRGLEIGDIEYAGYSIIHYCVSLLFLGVPLPELEKKVEDYLQNLTQLKHQYATTILQINLQTILNLQDKNLLHWSSPEYLQENAQLESELITTQNITTLFIFYVLAGFFEYSMGQAQVAVNHLKLAGNYVANAPGLLAVSEHNFYYSLALLAQYPELEESQQIECLKIVDANQQLRKIWVNHAPENFLHQYELVEAEKASKLKQNWQAAESYDRAIAGAKTNGYIQVEALANEQAAKFYLDWNKEKVAAGYLQEAYYCYARWGAKAKVADLEKRYPQLLTPILQQPRPTDFLQETIPTVRLSNTRGKITSTHSSSSICEAIDLATLLKASQAISGEIELDKLVAMLLEIVIANAGADQCVLLLQQENDLKLVGLLQSGETPEIFPSISLSLSEYIPLAIVNNVKRTLTPMVLVDARIYPQFIGDSYLQKRQPKSVLCSPIVNQGQLIGILYLENNLTIGAFTTERVDVLNLLAAQAAISLENARLYQAAQQALQDLQQAQLQIVQSEKMSALGNLVAGVAHEINNPVGFLAGNIQPALDYITDLLGLINLIQQKYPQLDPEVEAEIEAIELDYIREDLPNLVGSMREGVKRIKEISTSLRTFSRADKDYPVACNIHEGIDSTIMILKHRLKAKEKRPEIQVIKNYGNLPKIECYAGQLNQVFMNIIANAIDALDEKNEGQIMDEIQENPNQITVKTSVENHQVKISIADNGKGMSAEVKAKIFDHLFTTKLVGKGTGLGLAIARKIVVEKHKGSISVNSEIGVGTELIIFLPLKS